METTAARSEIIRKLDDISEVIGNTPLIRFENLHAEREIKLFAKAEWFQLGASIKARAAYNIIRHAILKGELDENRYLLDADMGDMSIAYATIAARLGIPVKICIPKNIPELKLKALRALGVEIHLTRADEYIEGARAAASKIYNKNPDKYFYADQYSNENNWKAHYYTTAEEIIEQSRGEITHFVAGLGITGSFMGAARRLKSFNRKIQVVALKPDGSKTSIEFWKHLDMAESSPFYDYQLADFEISISYKEAVELSHEIAKKEGLLLSPSSAGNVLGALKLTADIHDGTIVTILPDSHFYYGALRSIDAGRSF